MRDTSRIASLGLSLTMACALTVAPPAGGSTTGTSATSHNANTTGGNGNATGNGGAGSGITHSSGDGLLCAGLLASGILGDVFTVAPVSTTHRQDPVSAIQFAPIWSDSHQATVGNTVEPPTTKPAVAIIKLPISFSEADRQKFTAAGWKAHKTGAHGISYCLDRAGPSNAASSVTEGMICVTAAP